MIDAIRFGFMVLAQFWVRNPGVSSQCDILILYSICQRSLGTREPPDYVMLAAVRSHQQQAFFFSLTFRSLCDLVSFFSVASNFFKLCRPRLCGAGWC